MRYLFIYNPVSGKENNRANRIGKCLLQLGQGGNEVLVYQTQGKGDAGKYLSTAPENYDCVVVCGGDGTFHDVLNGVLENDIHKPIGYIPFGSTNDFASGIGIQYRNAVEVIRRGKRRHLDVGCFNGEYFSYVAAFGIFTNVSYSTPQNVKNALGYAAYLLEGIKQISQLRHYHLRVTTDNGTTEDDFLLGVVCNSISVAGMKQTRFHPSLNDGLMEYLFVKKPANIIDLQNTITSFLQGKLDEKYMVAGKSKNLEIQSEDAIEWTLDGEFGGTHKEVLIETCAKKLDIMAGPRR